MFVEAIAVEPLLSATAKARECAPSRSRLQLNAGVIQQPDTRPPETTRTPCVLVPRSLVSSPIPNAGRGAAPRAQRARGVIGFDPERPAVPTAGGASGRPFGLRAAGLEHSSCALLQGTALPHIVESAIGVRGANVSGSAV